MPRQRDATHHQYDLASKYLLDRWAGDLLALLFPDGAVRLIENKGAIELPSVARRIDHLLLVRRGRKKRLVHVEVQTEWTPDLPARIADYRTRLRFWSGLEVSSFVVCLTRPTRRVSTRFVEGTGPDRVEVGFRVIHLWDTRFSDRRLAQHPALIPLAILSESRSADDVARLDRRILHAGLPLQQTTDLRTLLGVFAGLRRFPRAVLSSLLEDPMVAQHPVLKDIANRAHAEGRAEGCAEGRVQEARAAVLRVIERRGLALRPADRRRIAAEPDIERLERWLDAAITAASVAELFDAAR